MKRNVNNGDWKLVLGIIIDILFLKGIINPKEMDDLERITTPQEAGDFIDRLQRGDYNDRRE